MGCFLQRRSPPTFVNMPVRFVLRGSRSKGWISKGAVCCYVDFVRWPEENVIPHVLAYTRAVGQYPDMVVFSMDPGPIPDTISI